MLKWFSSKARCWLIYHGLILVAVAAGWGALCLLHDRIPFTERVAHAMHPSAAQEAAPDLVRTLPPVRGQQGVLPLSGEYEKKSALLLSCKAAQMYGTVLVDIVKALHKRVLIICLVGSASEQEAVQGGFRSAGIPDSAVQFSIIPMDTMWLRDYGPFFVQRADGTVMVVQATYRFKRYTKTDDEHVTVEVRPEDEQVPSILAAKMKLPIARMPLDLAGGSLLSNGDGLGVFTYRVLVRNKQSRGYDVKKVFALLSEYLGFQRLVAVTSLKGEPTGHADMFMTFLAPDVAVVSKCDAKTDPENARRLDEIANALANLKTSRGPMRVYRVPLPPPKGTYWRTFTNIIMANGALLMPTFADLDPQMQTEAMETYSRLLPGWQIVGVRADPLLGGNGLLHCITMDVPAFVKLPAAVPPPATQGGLPVGLSLLLSFAKTPTPLKPLTFRASGPDPTLPGSR
jgi:agmatine deiminase